jgi:HAD superfamily hydrolase (TIGR01490 family)
MSAGPRRAAFFDVDETLITVKSMMRFLRFHLGAVGAPTSTYASTADRLESLVQSGRPREDANREYYRSFAGHEVAVVAEHGRRWFDRTRLELEIFHPPVLAAFAEHARDGDLTVLVSGSFSACLDPIRDLLRPDLVLCSVPAVSDGRYTGEIAVPMIGGAKADAARAVIAAHSLDAADCVAYGDHSSDLPFLEVVGRPVVVGTDPVLGARADRMEWLRLPGSATPSPRSA